MSNICPVCGFTSLREPPRSPQTGAGSYEICPSCGFEFGVTDDDRGITFEQWRSRWVGLGKPWSSRGIEPVPDEWDPDAQLRALIGGAAD